METIQPQLDQQNLAAMQAIENQVMAEQQAEHIANLNQAAVQSTVYRASGTAEGPTAVRLEVSIPEARVASERVLGEHVGAAVLPADRYVNPAKRGEIVAKVEAHNAMNFMHRQNSEVEAEALRTRAAGYHVDDLDKAA